MRKRFIRKKPNRTNIGRKPKIDFREKAKFHFSFWADYVILKIKPTCLL